MNISPLSNNHDFQPIHSRAPSNSSNDSTPEDLIKSLTSFEVTYPQAKPQVSVLINAISTTVSGATPCTPDEIMIGIRLWMNTAMAECSANTIWGLSPKGVQDLNALIPMTIPVFSDVTTLSNSLLAASSIMGLTTTNKCGGTAHDAKLFNMLSAAIQTDAATSNYNLKTYWNANNMQQGYGNIEIAWRETNPQVESMLKEMTQRLGIALPPNQT